MTTQPPFHWRHNESRATRSWLSTADNSFVYAETPAQDISILPLANVAAHVRFEDRQDVGHLHFRNPLDAPVFVRAGSILESDSTQPRLMIDDHVLEPNSSGQIEVRCVDVNRPMTNGAELRPSGRAAPELIRASSRMGQDSVWHAIEGRRERVGRTGTNLLGHLDAIDEAQLHLPPPTSGENCIIVVRPKEVIVEWFANSDLLAASVQEIRDEFKNETPGAFQNVTDVIILATEALRALTQHNCQADVFVTKFRGEPVHVRVRFDSAELISARGRRHTIEDTPEGYND